MASLLRSNIQDFVQEVPVGQPIKVLEGKRGRLNLPHANQGWRIYLAYLAYLICYKKVYPSINLSVFLSICLSSICLSICMSVSICLSIYLPLYHIYKCVDVFVKCVYTRAFQRFPRWWQE